MLYIIDSEKLERVELAGIAFAQVFLLGHGDEHGIDAFVNQPPECNNIIFFGCLVIIGSYPEVLVVNDMRRLIFVLATDKPAQVVVAGVNEMAKDFLLAPLMRIGLSQKFMIGYSCKSFRKIADDL